MRMKLQSAGERLYMLLRLVRKPFLVNTVTVKQRIQEKKENPIYTESIGPA